MRRLVISILIFLILCPFLEACGQTGRTSNDVQSSAIVCTPYSSAYEVVYPDRTLVKSEVSNCSSGLYSVKSEDGKKSFQSANLTVQLIDAQGKLLYEPFQGQ